MPDRPNAPLASRRTALVVLAVALAATFFGAWRESDMARDVALVRWHDALAQLDAALAPALAGQYEMLAVQARTALRPGRLSETDWNGFLAATDWRERFPGLREIGCAELEGAKWVVKFSTSPPPAPGFPPGFDLAGDAMVRDALHNLAAAGQSATTRTIMLGRDRVVIGLLPLPAPAGSARPRSVLFFALDPAAYFHAVQPKLPALPLTIRLLDGAAAVPPLAENERLITYHEPSGDWRFVATLESPAATEVAPPWIVLFGGTALSILLYSLFATQARMRREAEMAGEKLRARETEITALNRGLEQKVAERTAQLHEANSELVRFKAIVDATTDFVNITDVSGRLLYINPSGRRITGIPPEEDATQLTVKDFSPDWVMERFIREGFPAALRDGSWRAEVSLLHRDGHEIPMSFVGLVLKSETDQPLFMACVARDISEQRRAEEELQRALAEEKELNRLKSNFISMVTHEIRTPLSLILGSSEILSRYLGRLAPEKRTSHLHTIASAVQRMSGLLEDVLLFSKAEAGRMGFNPVQLDLKDFCTQFVDELVSATHRRCPVELAVGDCAPARADENLLRHILSNLVANAVKYSPPGAPVQMSVTREAGDAVFVVADHGLGIPQDDRKHLFTAFHRGKNVATIPGTGLGLVIVKHCVEQHGGQIKLESVENRGTKATVRLPLFSPAHTDFIRRIAQNSEHEDNPGHRR